MSISDDYHIESNRGYGLGRPDIVIMPKEKNKTAYIFEFKYEYSASTLSAEDAAREALRQIEVKKYGEGVKKTGVEKSLKIGLGFKGTEVKTEYFPD